MSISKGIGVFLAGFLCAFVLFSIDIKRGNCQSNISANISFSADSNSIYFFDRDEAKIYRYTAQGRMTRTYILKELGKDLLYK